MAIRFLSSQDIQAGTLTVSTIDNLATTAYQFLVSDSGLVKYRTGNEVLHDIGAGTVSSITISPGTGISGGGTVTAVGTLTITNSDRGSSQAIFKNIAVSGQTTVTALINNDILNLAAGSNVTITTNAATDTITIAATDTNNFPSSLAWDTATGILTLGRTGLTSLTVDLDDRYPLNNGTGATGTWGIGISGNAASANTALITTGTSGGAITSYDIRTIAPSSMASYRMGFGFTSFSNNNTAPYADYLHLRSYTDASGGNDNLVMFRKDAIGMRIYQQTWNSAAAYANYKDIAFTDGTNASGTWGITTTGSAASLTTARTFTIGNTGKTFNGTADVSWTLAEIGAYASTNPSGYTSNTGTVTSVSGTGTVSGLSLTGTVTSSGSLTLGGTLAVTPSNFSSQANNTFLAGPGGGGSAVPTFRAIAVLDVPTLNQNTTGTAANVSGVVAVANGGTGTATPSLVQGTGVTITGSWPNQTIAASGGGGGSITKLQSQTLTSASWLLVSGYYTYTFSNALITLNTRVDFTPDRNSYTEVTTCGMQSQVTIATGSCTFYSLFPPQTNITGEITIFPTVAGN